jgi:uncharacterized protein DUF4276
VSNFIGIIVDGPGDYASLRARFIGAVRVVKADGPRGHAVTVQQIISSSRKQVAMLSAIGCPYIILMLDFEERTVDYFAFVSQLEAEVKRHGMPARVEICVANRMIENWFLADVEAISAQKAYIRNNVQQKPFEGTHGKKELKKIFVKGFSYGEVKHGPELFGVIRFEVARNNSASFECFLEKLKLT